MLTILLCLGALVVAGLVTFKWMKERPLFEPGTVEARIRARGESLDPVSGWQVTADVALHHFGVGDGRDLLVVHGGPGLPPKEPWRVAALTGDVFRWHFYDQRGSGRSTRPFTRAPAGGTWKAMQAVEATLGLAEQIADIERIRRLLGKENLVLVGHSFGALIAALYAAEWPERVAALILVSPAPLLEMPVEGGDLFTLVRERLDPGARAGFDAYMAKYFNFPALLEKDEAELSAFFGELGRYYGVSATKPGGFMTLASYLSLGRRHDWTARMRRVEAPVIVVHGSADLQPRAASRRVASAFPNGRLVEIPDGGHFLYEDRAEELAAIMRDGVPR